MPTGIRSEIDWLGNRSFHVSGKTKRAREFAHGRKITSTLLSQFNETGIVGVAADRSPIWPPGFIGSISHSDHFVWGVVGKDSAAISIGIDTEIIVDKKTQAQLRAEIATTTEWQIAEAMELDRRATFTLVFSAKEAFYKCCYPMNGEYFGFKDVMIESLDDKKIRLAMRQSNPHLANPSFSGEAHMPSTLDVFFYIYQGSVFTLTWVDRSFDAGRESR